VLVVSNDFNNKFSSTITVLPITSKIEKVFPFDVYVEKDEGNLPKPSKIKADQIRTIDKMRIVKGIGELTNTTMEKVEKAICIHLNIASF
jgi:mRNA interferase MazF